MILTIAVTSLGIGNLFLLNSLKLYSREIFWLALMNGIFIIRSAHLIFDGTSISHGNHPLMVDAVFTILYLPALCILFCIINRWMISVRFLLYGSALFGAVFVFLYYNIFISASMPVISYSLLIWQVELIGIIFIAREIWIKKPATKRILSPLTRSHIYLVKLWCTVIIIPYLFELLTTFFPPDNFIIPYRPLISTQIAVQLATGVVLILFMAGVVRHKIIAEKERSNVVSRKLKDLAF